MEFELGRVEGALARQLLPAEFRRVRPAARPRRAGLPRPGPTSSSLPNALVGPERELDRVIGEAEVAVDRVEQVAEAPRLLDQLVLAAEDVGVVLGELAHAHDAVQRAVRLVAVAAAELGEPERQVAVAVDALLEDLDVGRAVHRLQRHQIGLAREDRLAFLGRRHFVGHDEHVLAILAPVARLLPLPGVHQLRGLDLDDSRRRRAGGAYRPRAGAR